jgi:hypothetical protein
MDITPIIEFFDKRWEVIQPFRGTFFTVLFAVAALGVGAASWHYSGSIDGLNGQIKLRDDQIKARDDEVERYKRALGILPGSKGNLLELTAEELKAKASNLGERLHKFCASVHDLQGLSGDAYMQAFLEAGNQFDQTLRADAYLVDNELRRRIDPKALAAIPNIDQSFKAPDGTPIEPSTLFGERDQLGAMLSCQLGITIDELARVLPSDKH